MSVPVHQQEHPRVEMKKCSAYEFRNLSQQIKRMDMTKNSCYEYTVPGGANRQDDNMDPN